MIPERRRDVAVRQLLAVVPMDISLDVRDERGAPGGVRRGAPDGVYEIIRRQKGGPRLRIRRATEEFLEYLPDRPGEPVILGKDQRTAQLHQRRQMWELHSRF